MLSSVVAGPSALIWWILNKDRVLVELPMCLITSYYDPVMNFEREASADDDRPLAEIVSDVELTWEIREEPARRESICGLRGAGTNWRIGLPEGFVDADGRQISTQEMLAGRYASVYCWPEKPSVRSYPPGPLVARLDSGTYEGWYCKIPQSYRN